MSTRPRFHLAFPVVDLEAARRFYVDVLGCGTGRECPDWIDFDFEGHQIVAHLAPEESSASAHDVDGKAIPVRHYGLILPWDRWEQMADRLRQHGIPFLVEPYVRFARQPGEQGTLFVRDPSGNALEFKTFRSDDAVFAR